MTGKAEILAATAALAATVRGNHADMMGKIDVIANGTGRIEAELGTVKASRPKWVNSKRRSAGSRRNSIGVAIGKQKGGVGKTKLTGADLGEVVFFAFGRFAGRFEP